MPIKRYKESCYRSLYLIVSLSMLSMVSYAKPSKIDSVAAKMTTIEQRMSAEEQEIACVEKEVALCEKEISTLNKHVDRANEAVANQIAASSHTIQAWGIIIAILAFALGFYINRMWRRIEEATTNAQAVQQELQKLHADIRNNMQTIYAKLQREETKALLAQLEKVPETMFNTEDILLARELEEEDFSHLLKAYHTLIQQRLELNGKTSIPDLRVDDIKFISLEGSYALQFAQHFMDKAIADPELRQIVLVDIDTFYKTNFFKSDAIKSTEGYKRGVMKLDETLQTELISTCISAIIGSPYEKISKLYVTLLEGIKEEQLCGIWDNVTKEKEDAFSFAKSMKDILVKLNPQSPLLEKIEAYIEKETETKQNQ